MRKYVNFQITTVKLGHTQIRQSWKSVEFSITPIKVSPAAESQGNNFCVIPMSF